MRNLFVKRGIPVSPGALATVLASQAGATVPTAFVSSSATAALGLTTTTITTTTSLSTAMNLLNAKTAAAILSAAIITGTTTYLVKEREAEHLRADLQSRAAAETQWTDARTESLAALRLKDQQIGQLRQEVNDLPRLRGEVDRLNRELAQMTRLRADNEALRNQLVASARQTPVAGSVADDQPLDLSEYGKR